MVHSDSDLILHNSSVLIDKEPNIIDNSKKQNATDFSVAFRLYYSNQIWIGKPNANSEASMTISPRDG